MSSLEETELSCFLIDMLCISILKFSCVMHGLSLLGAIGSSRHLHSRVAISQHNEKAQPECVPRDAAPASGHLNREMYMEKQNYYCAGLEYVNSIVRNIEYSKLHSKCVGIESHVIVETRRRIHNLREDASRDEHRPAALRDTGR